MSTSVLSISMAGTQTNVPTTPKFHSEVEIILSVTLHRSNNIDSERARSNRQISCSRRQLLKRLNYGYVAETFQAIASSARPGLIQRQLVKAVGVYERAARYWELKESKAFARKDRGRVARSWCDRICNSDRRCAACPDVGGRFLRKPYGPVIC
jgi:hypothetical protein